MTEGGEEVPDLEVCLTWSVPDLEEVPDLWLGRRAPGSEERNGEVGGDGRDSSLAEKEEVLRGE